MKSVTTGNKVIWAVDAFTDDLSLHKKAASVLKAWTKGAGVSIEPVYILSPDQLGVPPEAFVHLAPEGQIEAKKRLTKLMKTSGLTNLLEPKFISSKNFSLRMAVDALLDYARSTNATFILASTQSRKGVSRFLFGSFAESLVLQSEIPVFLVSPKTQPSALKHVFFSTDLSEKSKEAFEEIVREAKERQFKITVYNNVEYFTDYSVTPVMSSNVYKELMAQDLLKRKAQTNDLVEYAKSQGVTATAKVDNQAKEPNVAAAILKAATKAKADTIAMASQSGRVASALLGSVTRQVLRGAKHPVWVIHPRAREEQMPSKKPALSMSTKKGTVAV